MGGGDRFPRPIPARAGEPWSGRTAARSFEAYPRPRGGATDTAERWLCLSGLSPPARGSHARLPPLATVRGPIPARAGEPGPVRRRSWLFSAYPRPRGGAPSAVDSGSFLFGLSPPARGSQDETAGILRAPGPIPARAGEPRTPSARPSFASAYPRPRGGAEIVARRARGQMGLSPPARGSLGCPRAHQFRRGPIPARAGEPRSAGRAAPLVRAYPRPRGGAR